MGLKIFIKKSRQRAVVRPAGDYVFRRNRALLRFNKVTAEITPVTARQRLHELYQLRSRVVRGLLVLVPLCAALAYLQLTFIPEFDIRPAAQPGASLGKLPPNYQKTLNIFFDSRPWQRFGFALDSVDLESKMLTEFPELDGFKAVKNWYGGGVSFVAWFRRPVVVWRSAQRQVYVDDSGSAFSLNRFSEEPVSVNDQSGIAPVARGSLASKRFIYFLGKMVGALSKSVYGPVTSVSLPASTREIDISLRGRGYVVKTDIDRDPIQQAQDITNAIKYFETHKIKPQYIDARVGGKVFYR